jgi:hypothetical protein
LAADYRARRHIRVVGVAVLERTEIERLDRHLLGPADILR